MNWSRVADLTQRAIVWSMVGLTVYASAVLARRSYGLVQRHRKIKSLEFSPTDEVVTNQYTGATCNVWRFIAGAAPGNETGCPRGRREQQRQQIALSRDIT